MAARIDLNADLGEMPGPAGAAHDALLMDVVSSASIACGAHAGDPASMRRAVSSAGAAGVVIGAHVSYPDRANFGRTPMDLPFAALVAELAAQVRELQAAAAESGARVRYIKAHGALYNSAVAHDDPARGLIEVAGSFGLPLLTIPTGRLAELARAQGIGVYAEFFADRAYEVDGRLRPRSLPGAVVTDPDAVAERTLGAARHGTVASYDGTAVAVAADSICVHGDTPGALTLARRVRESLEAAGVAVAAFLP